MNYLVRGGVVLFTQRAAVVKGERGKMAAQVDAFCCSGLAQLRLIKGQRLVLSFEQVFHTTKKPFFSFDTDSDQIRAILNEGANFINHGHRRDGGLKDSNESKIYNRRNCNFEKCPLEIPQLQKNGELYNQGKEISLFSGALLLCWRGSLILVQSY